MISRNISVIEKRLDFHTVENLVRRNFFSGCTELMILRSVFNYDPDKNSWRVSLFFLIFFLKLTFVHFPKSCFFNSLIFKQLHTLIQLKWNCKTSNEIYFPENNLFNTVWKFKNFSMKQILREIIFCLFAFRSLYYSVCTQCGNFRIFCHSDFTWNQFWRM